MIDTSQFKEIKQDLSVYAKNVSLIQLFTQVSNKRKEVIKAVDQIKDFYLVEAIVQQYVEDSLSPDITTGDVLDVSSDDKVIDRELKFLDERFSFDSLIEDVVSDLLMYGEYTLRTEVKKKEGLVDLIDDVDQANVFLVPKFGSIWKYLVREDKVGYSKAVLKEPYEYVKFILSGRKIRVDLRDELGVFYNKIKKEVPRYVRVGRSIIYSVLPKLQELKLLEALVPTSKLVKVTSGSVIGVSVPSNLPPEKAFKVAKKVEGLLNKRVGVSSVDKSLTIENAIASVGRIKVVPVFGDKGNLSKFDYKMDEPDDLTSSIEDLRRTICNSIGIPYEILFGGDSPKGELLKRYARYLRRLRAIQKSIVSGIRQIVFIHLTNKGISFKPSDVRIEFRNKLVEIDNLDTLEFIDTSINMLSGLKDFVDTLKEIESESYSVDIDRFLEFLDKQLSIVGLTGLIKNKSGGVSNE